MNGQYDLALAFQNGWGVQRDLQTANAWFSRALPSLRSAGEQGDFRAQTFLGFTYALGLGVERNDAVSSAWFNNATDLLYALGKGGDPWAQTSIGYMYSNGWGFRRDYAAAVAWLRHPADLGSQRHGICLVTSIRRAGTGCNRISTTPSFGIAKRLPKAIPTPQTDSRKQVSEPGWSGDRAGGSSSAIPPPDDLS